MDSPEPRRSEPGAALAAFLPRGAVRAAERDALATGAAFVARDQLAHITLSGTGRLACLQGLVSCDVEKPGDDSHLFGALLTAKGMIVSPLWITRLTDVLLVEAPSAAGAALEESFARLLPPRLCQFDVTTASTASLGVYGPAAADALARATPGEPPAALGRVTRLPAGGAPLVVARVAARGVEGFDCTGPAAAIETLAARLEASGTLRASPALLEERRILAGFPRLGAEIDARTLPQEVRLDELGALSYTKGCYLGQETVARLHFRGHANRRLAGLQLDRAPAALPADLAGTERPLGRLTSACWWEAGGGYAGLAVLRRELAAGATVEVAGGVAGTVHALPWEPSGGDTAT
jgi:folate-binding protein YgfZ